MLDLVDLSKKLLTKIVNWSSKFRVQNQKEGTFFTKNKLSIFRGDTIKNIKLFIDSKLRFFLSTKRPEEEKLILSLSKRKIPNIQQLRQLRHFLSHREKKVILISILLLIFSTTLLGGRFLWQHLIEVPKYGGEYTEGLVGSVQYINPILSQGNDVDRDISRLIFSGLFKIDPQGELENDLIDRYQISEDQKTYTFFLKKNILWHDKRVLSADDIGFTLAAIQNPTFKSPLYKTLKGVVFQKISDNSFKLILTEPFSPFISTLTFGILPMHLWENIDPQNSTLTELNKKPIGTGPFKYESFKKDSMGNIKQYTLTNFKDYYGQRAYLKTIVLKLFSSSDDALNALKNNQVQGISFLSQKNYKEIVGSDNFTVHNFNMPQYSALFFNPQKQELLKDKDIRKVLSLAINKKAILTELGSGLKEAYGPLDFIISPQQDKYDLEAAQEILKRDGWKLKEGLLEKDDQKLELTITSVDNDEYIKILQAIKKQWAKLGIITNLEIIPRQKIASQIIEPRNYQILLIAQILSYDPDPYPFWHSSQMENGLNLSLFANRDIDRILEEARKTTSFKERLKKYKDFQEILKRENIAIFLFRSTYHYPMNNDIQGMNTKVIYFPSDRFSNVENWYLKTKKKFKK